MRFSLLASSLLCLMAVNQSVRGQATDAPKAAVKDEAVAIKGAIKVDGEIDEEWKDVPELAVEKPVRSETTISEDKMAKAKVKLKWNEGHLYALFQVTDPKLSDSSSNDYEQDSIELFVDELNQKAGSYQEDDAQYRVSYKGKVSGDGAGYSADNVKVSTKEVEGGYVVEMSVKLSHAKCEAGTKLGVELQVNDDSGSGMRGAITKWNHDENDSYLDTSHFGTVTLK